MPTPPPPPKSTPWNWRLPAAFLGASLALFFSADSLERLNFYWVLSGAMAAWAGAWGYRRARAIEPHRHDVLMLLLAVFPIILVNRWAGEHLFGEDARYVEGLGLVLFAYYVSRYATLELRHLEDRMGKPGICADSLMISTSLVAGSLLVLAAQDVPFITQQRFAWLKLAYLTPGVYLLIAGVMIAGLGPKRLGRTDVVLSCSAVLVFMHFGLDWFFASAQGEVALDVIVWSRVALAAAAAGVMLYMHMPRPPQVPPKPVHLLTSSSLVGAAMLVLAVPVAWLVLGERASRAPVWLWVSCGVACSLMLAMRLIPLLAQALRWKEAYQRLALQDGLTGLASRHALDALASEMVQAGHEEIMVFSVDLDDFKSINDLYGHPVGDVLLRAVADKLREQVALWKATWPAPYVVARLGGDEFLILATAPAGTWSRRLVSSMADELYRNLARWWTMGLERPVFCKASVGCEFMSGTHWQAALQNADKALYASKLTHTGPVLGAPGPSPWVPHRQEIREWTHQALAAPHLPLDLQAIVCARSQRVTGYEVLARLPHPTEPGQRLMPNTFLTVIDSDGLHRLLCSRILETLAAHRQSLGDMPLAINIDPCLLTSIEAAQWLHQQVLANGLKPELLTLELLEKQVTEDACLHEAMAWLSQQGYRLAMDDFGCGHSNFQRLSALPFNVLKIDAVVIHAAAQGDEAPLHSIRQLAMGRNMAMVAEGVATLRHLAAVQRAGIELVQGYLHSRPCPIDLIAAHELELEAMAFNPA